MYYVINAGWSNRIIVPMNDKTSTAIALLYGTDNSTVSRPHHFVEEYYVPEQGSAFQIIPNTTIIEVWSPEKIKEFIERGLANPRPK